MVRLFGEEKAPLLETYRDDIESPKANPDTDAVALEELRAAERARLCRRRRRRRFFHFLALTVLTLAFIGVRHYKRWGKNNISRLFPEDEPHHLPVVPGITLGRCTNWKGDSENGPGSAVFGDEDGYYIPPRPKRPAPVHKHFGKGSPMIQAFKSNAQAITSTAEFKLDADKPLFFVSRGGFSYGHLDVRQSEDDSTDVKTTVTVTTDSHDDSGHWHEHFLDVIRVCEIKKEGDDEATGVGIFTPEWHHRGPGHKWKHHHNVKFHVTVEVPKSEDLLTLKSLVTDMPIFSQSLLTEKGAVSYQHLHLNGALAAIDALDASGENVTVFNSNAAIEGNFKASNSIILRTANAQIDVSLELENANSSRPATASLLTSNARIISRSTLTASDWSEDNTGNFTIFANTANAKIQLTFPSAPVNSTLDLTANTALGSVDASLHPTYEGEFFLTTSLGKAEVLLSEGEPDPEDRDRKRTAMTRPMRSEVFGETWWGDYKGKQKHWGNVKIKTSLASATLRFGGGDD